MLRGSRGDAAGTELGSSFVERIDSEHGNRLGLRPAAVLPARVVGLGASSTDRVGTGRSRRSTPSRGEPAHMGKGRQQSQRRWRSSLSEAVRRQRLMANPAALARPPRVETAEIDPLTASECRDILKAARHTPNPARGSVAPRSGWGDVAPIPGPAQTPGRRASDAPGGPATAQDAAGQRLGPLPRRCLLDRPGTPIDPAQDYRERKQLLRTAVVRDVRLHDARHTAATRLLLQGVDIRTVMAIMGWTDLATAQRYVHAVDELRHEAARTWRLICGVADERPSLLRHASDIGRLAPSSAGQSPRDPATGERPRV